VQNMTPEQQADHERLKRYIVREQLCSVMNNTKWREALAALQAIPHFHVRFRVKCLREDDPDPNQWDGSFPWHVPRFDSIEWLEIDPLLRQYRGALVDDVLVDFTEPVTQALRSVHVPYSIENSRIRIWGYTRPASSSPLV
jgi:hypothetical protein